MQRRCIELAARLEPAVGDAGAQVPSDAGVGSAVGALALEIDQLRLAFLRLPIERRTAVLEAEQEARKNVLDRAAAKDDLERAVAEKQRAEEASGSNACAWQLRFSSEPNR